MKKGRTGGIDNKGEEYALKKGKKKKNKIAVREKGTGETKAGRRSARRGTCLAQMALGAGWYLPQDRKRAFHLQIPPTLFFSQAQKFTGHNLGQLLGSEITVNAGKCSHTKCGISRPPRQMFPKKKRISPEWMVSTLHKYSNGT